jgi:carbon storage regulator
VNTKINKELKLLILTRRIGERLVINGNIYLKVLAVKGRQVLLGADAPDHIPVNREEVQQRIDEDNSNQKMNEWRKKMQLYDMLTNRYHFNMIDGSLHYSSDDKNHEGAMNMSQKERLNIFINLTRLLETISQGEQ